MSTRDELEQRISGLELALSSVKQENELLRTGNSPLQKITSTLFSSLSKHMEDYSTTNMMDDIKNILSEIHTYTGATRGDISFICDASGQLPSPERYHLDATHHMNAGSLNFGDFAGLWLNPDISINPMSTLAGMTKVAVTSGRYTQLYYDPTYINQIFNDGIITICKQDVEIEALKRIKAKSSVSIQQVDAWIKSAEERPENEDFLVQRQRWFDTGIPFMGDPTSFSSFGDYIMYTIFPFFRDYEDSKQLVGWTSLRSFKGLDGTKPLPEETMDYVQKLTDLLAIPITVALYAKKFSDIQNDRLNLEKALAEERRLRELQGMTGQVAHEISNKAVLVRNNVELAQDALTQDSLVALAKQNPMLNDALRTVYNRIANIRPPLDSIINSVRRNRAAVQADRVELGVYSLNDEIRGYALPGVSTLDLDPKINDLKFDTALMYDVLSNAVINAKRAVDERAQKECEYQSNIIISTRKLDSVVEIIVRDNGIGMTKEQLDKLILEERFTTKTGGEGVTGLGTSIMRNYIRAQGGSINYSSKPGETEVKITMPYITS